VEDAVSPGTAYTFDPQGSAVQPVTLYLPGQPPFLKVRSSSAFDPFGALRATATADSADTYDPIGFGGQHGYYRDYAGLYLLTHRYYDAGAGRFVTRDPIGYRGGINLYGFTGNNPVNESDPEGTQAENGPNLLMPPLYDQNPAGPVYDGSAANSQEHPSTAAILSGRVGRSARAARRQAMRKLGIPTSRKPVSQMNTVGGRQYTYIAPKSGGGSHEMVVTHHQADTLHPHPHWEAGVAKHPSQVDPLGRRSYFGGKGTPHQKVKVEYKE